MSFGSKITVRETPVVEVTTREVPIDIGSMNTEERSVRAAFTTETPVRTWQWDIRQVVDEVLLSSGMLPVDHVPMLSQHYHYDPEAVIGSGISPRAEGGEIVGTLRFGTDLGDHAEAIWKRVQQRHMRSVSAGYDVLEFVDIPAGESRSINGQTYTASNRTLRVTTKWRLREISVVVIPADHNAQMRAAGQVGKNGATPADSENVSSRGTVSHNSHGSNTMGLVVYLRSLGLADNADTQAIATFVRGLTQDQRSHARGLANKDELSQYFSDAGEAGGSSRSSSGGQSEGAGQGSAGSAPSRDPITTMTGARGGDGGQTGNTDAILLAERNRVAEIHRLAGDQIPADVVRRAVDTGMTVDQAGAEFYRILSSRSNPVGHNGHVGIHSRSASSEATIQTLQIGLMMRNGIEPDAAFLATMQARGMFGSHQANARWIPEAARAMQGNRANAGDEAARAIEIASRRFRNVSLPDIAAHCLRIAGQEVPESREEMVQRAYTSAPFVNIFTTNFSAVLLRAYLEAPDTTQGWVMEEDLPNHESHDLVQFDPLTSLRKKTKNVPGQQQEGSDRKESYAAERFVGTVSIDEVDILADRMRAFGRVPQQMGAAARRLRPDMVYAVLLQNPQLASGTALFAAAHSNLAGSAALSPTTLNAAYAAMALQKRNGAILGIAATHLIVPMTKRGLARSLTQSDSLRNTTANTEYGTMNYNQGLVEPVAEARLDAGFADPDNFQSTIAGQPASWWLVDRNNSPIYVGYVEGTGRAPRLRSRVINRPGEYGLEWDVCMDIGVGVSDYVGILKRQEGSI